MAKSFNTASTDKITTAYTTHSATRTYSIWTYRTGNGGGGLGRIFDKRVGGAQVELLRNDAGGGTPVYVFDRNFSGGQATWNIIAPAANEWHNITVTYDSSGATNDPIFYVDGTATALNVNSNSTGTANTNDNAYVLGNRGNDNARVWGGYLAEFAVWNRILTAAEIASLGDGFAPIFYPSSLALYAPLIRNSFDYKGTGALTESGTAVINHPRIIYPSGFQIFPFTAAAVASTTFPSWGYQGGYW